MFHCVLLVLVGHEERGHRLISLCIWNIIYIEYLLFSIHSLCWVQDAKLGRNVQALEGVF